MWLSTQRLIRLHTVYVYMYGRPFAPNSNQFQRDDIQYNVAFMRRRDSYQWVSTKFVFGPNLIQGQSSYTRIIESQFNHGAWGYDGELKLSSPTQFCHYIWTITFSQNTALLYFMSKKLWRPTFIISSLYSTAYYVNNLAVDLLERFKQTIGEGFIYLRGLAIIFIIDASLTDDEPLWEPVEWSLVQSWIMFIFLFAWIAENLISSRYGSYTGRDKRVWFSWYKTFWLVELWYVLSLGAASLFVIVPFYYEVTYTTSFIVSWWHWYSRVFFFKFVGSYTIILLISYYLQINIRYFNWKKNLLLIVLINIFLSYLLYIHFMMSFFGYFTDRNWYHKARLVDYIQLSHEPNKWAWGSDKRDHFTQHKSTTVFWFKNDGPFASAFLFYHLFFFIALFTLYIYWITLARRVYATQEVTYTFTIYCISALKQFFYFFFLLYILVFLSFILSYWRMPVEQAWMISSSSWFSHLLIIGKDYWQLVLQIFTL